LRTTWHALPLRVRTRINAGYREFGYRVDLANRAGRSATVEDACPDVVQSRLREHYAPDGALLSSLLGTDLPW
jgi:hypothetical protein